MNAKRTRRIRNILISTLLLVLIIAGVKSATISQHQETHWIGWILLACLTILILFNLRKKLNFIPLGKAYTWAQIHYYLGISVAVLFFHHIHWSLPNGVLDTTLFLCMALALVSGVIGLLISRIYPPILADRGPQILYERIPRYRSEIKDAVENHITDAIRSSKGSTLPEFYEAKLLPYLSKQANFHYHAFDSGTPYKFWSTEFSAIKPFLDDSEKLAISKIEELTRSKTHLDLCAASYQALRYWLFFHIPVSYLTLALAIVHAIQMTTYS